MQIEIKELIKNLFEISTFVDCEKMYGEANSKDITYALGSPNAKIKEREYNSDGRLVFEQSHLKPQDEYMQYFCNSHFFQYMENDIILETIGEVKEDPIYVTRKLDVKQRPIFEIKIHFGDEYPPPYHFEYKMDKLISIKRYWKKGDIYYIGSYKCVHSKESTKPDLEINLIWNGGKLTSIIENIRDRKRSFQIEHIINLEKRNLKANRSYNGNAYTYYASYIGNAKKIIKRKSVNFNSIETQEGNTKIKTIRSKYYHYDKAKFTHGYICKYDEMLVKTEIKENAELFKIKENYVELEISEKLIKNENDMQH